jgi:hypothetical protein
MPDQSLLGIIYRMRTLRLAKSVTMGTAGLKIIRYCSKYYLYYTRLDGNPEIVGSDIVELIPTENEHYQSWFMPSLRVESKLSC